MPTSDKTSSLLKRNGWKPAGEHWTHPAHGGPLSEAVAFYLSKLPRFIETSDAPTFTPAGAPTIQTSKAQYVRDLVASGQPVEAAAKVVGMPLNKAKLAVEAGKRLVKK